MKELFFARLDLFNEQYHFTPTQQCLYFRLLFLCCNPQPQLYRTWDKDLFDKMNVSDKTFTEARNRLVDTGMIGFKKHTKASRGCYKLILPGVPAGFEPAGIILPADPGETPMQAVYQNREKELRETFDVFRKRYPGVKRGLDTEYANFRRKHKDYKEVLPLLLPAIEKQIKWTNKREDLRIFAPPYSNLQTWINQRRWENELPNDSIY